jgi:hypothetical protein
VYGLGGLYERYARPSLRDELSEAKVITRAQTVRNVIYIVKELKLPEELRGKILHRGV